MRYLTIALAKGRLADKAMEMFEAIGISCDEMKDKDSRKLIFVNEELGIRFFLAKASDVPTYVEYGAADIGIVGKDTILEEGRKLYEVMDTVLSPRERMVITLRYGLGDRTPLTQREIAAKCGISRSYVSRIEKNAVLKLRDRFFSA